MEPITEQIPNEIPTDPTNPISEASPGASQTLLDKIGGASDGAVSQFVGEQPKRSRGRPITTGKYSKKTIPLGSVADASPAPFFPQIQAQPNPAIVQEPQAPFDPEAASAIIEGVLELANNLLCEKQRMYALSLLNDAAEAEKSANAVRCPAKLETALKKSGVKLWEKYLAGLNVSDETIVGGVCIAWTAIYFSQRKNIRDVATGKGK